MDSSMDSSIGGYYTINEPKLHLLWLVLLTIPVLMCCPNALVAKNVRSRSKVASAGAMWN